MNVMGFYSLFKPQITNMKLSKYILVSVAALAIGMVSCSDDKPQESTKVPTGSGTTGDKDNTNNDDVVSPKPSFTCTTQNISVNSGTTYQEMEGFGASDCWLPNTIGKYWSNKLQIARLLFAKPSSQSEQPQGIGLSMWRVNIGAGSSEQGDNSGITSVNNRAESYYYNNVWNWDKCEGQRYFMQQALNNGCEKFVLFSNSPLVQYTKNGQGRSANGAYANLKEDCYGAFAEYMATVADHFTAQGYNISHISPVNEPQYNWDGESQEGSGWQNSEIAKLSRELDAALTAHKLDNTKILLAEAASWEYLYKGDNGRENVIAELFGTGDNSVANLSHVEKAACGHSYWTFDNWSSMRNVRSQVASKAKQYNVKVWQTEWSMLDACPSELGGDYDKISEFDIAIYMSKIIHNDITVAGCSSWSYWTAMSVERWSQKNRFELIKTTPSGGNYSDDFTTGGTIEATPNLWVLGNYSLFIRPGYVRVDLSLNESKDFFGTAYMAPDNSKLVVVYTNMNATKGVKLNETRTLPGEVKSIYTYTTSESKQLTPARFNTNDQVFLDPYSVTTVVYNF
jgi:O-glycosyl hydrolase